MEHDAKEQQVGQKEFSYKDYSIEDYVALGIFWLLALTVFAQFFTRYVLSAPFIWTEEVARYLLICVTFVGSTLGVRRNSHIFVEFFYRYIPKGLGRVLVTIVDIIRIAFMVVCARLAIILIDRMSIHALSSIDVSLSVIYGIIAVGFVLMTIRSIHLAWIHWRDKYLPTQA